MRRKAKVAAIGLLPVLVAAAVIAVLVVPHGVNAASTTTLTRINPNTDGSTADSGVDTSSAIVQLKGDPLSTYVKTKPAQGKKIDFNNSTVKSYRAQLSALRNDFKQWLQSNAPKAKVTGEYDISLNAVAVQLNGTSLASLQAAPMVQQATYELLYQPTTDATADPDLNLISAFSAWAANGGSSANAGEGVKVAVVDTGIDITNPCFSDAGYPAVQHLGDPSLTNNKVIAAKVFSNKTPSRGFTAAALQEHGTHVAGTIACNYDTPASVNGVAIPHGISGVAPRALLGNYNIFPGDDATGITNARSEDILNALDAAYQDGFDIANMSLGGNAHGIQDLLTNAVDDLDQAGMVVAIAAGNSGPGHYTVESPGSAARALTAGASTVGHIIAAPITTSGGTYAGVTGDFALVSSDLTATLGVVTTSSGALSQACSALPANSLSGKIALISRGTCSFSTKIRNSQGAGAAAVLVVNNVAGDGIAMGQDGTPNQPTVPAYMVSLANKAGLMAQGGTSVTIGAALAYLTTPNNDLMAGFSSQGPTDVDFRVKPDVVAPGVNVLSSIPHQFCATPPCFAFFQGTSMATPHLAGSAAVVKWEHPTWSAAQIRSAIVNTADRDALKNYRTGAPESDVNVIGAGRENLLSAVNATVALDPVSVSFGAIPQGSGQTQTFTVTLSNLTNAAENLTVSVGSGDASVGYSVSPGTVSLAPGDSATITVTMTAVKGAALGDHQAWLTIANGGTVVGHAAVYTFIKQ